ncbi:hypothetical protein F5B19DRAFT_502157 [Rostrohypoxylon terebratum]|nr:hypothetical protein F5B19DRAFT_502157 [Rostrohypoxylon terebratum]
MANRDQAHLFRMPVEIIFMILDEMTEPADYFHLAMACKGVSDNLDVEYEIIRRERRNFYRRASLEHRSPDEIFRRNGHNTVMNWAIRTRIPQDKFLALAQRYAEVFPEAIWGNHSMGLGSAAEYCEVYCNSEALDTLETAGLVQSTQTPEDQIRR